jgi:hypothetical protein
MDRGIICAILAVLCIASTASAASGTNSTFTSFLNHYNISNSTISSISFVPMTYEGNSYIGAYKGSGLFLLVNETGGYSFVMNASSISAIIRNTTIQSSIASADFMALRVMVGQYWNSSASSINDCKILTGLNNGLTCTTQNNCMSCSTVPSCNEVLYSAGGSSGVFGAGIATFEVMSDLLSRSTGALYSNVSGINSTNVQVRIKAISASVSNISQATQDIYQNPIFPPTSNITNAQMSTCVNYPVLSQAPWYCTALGYCNALTYNYTLLARINSRMAYINGLPFSDGQISRIAANASMNAYTYVAPVVSQEKTMAYGTILNTTLLNYSATVNRTNILLFHIYNQSLKSSLQKLEHDYSNLSSSYLYANITEMNSKLGSDMKNLSGIYLMVNGTYSSMLSMAKENTAILVEAQLNGAQGNGIANLSLSEAALNNELNGRVSNVSATQLSLARIFGRANSAYSSSVPLLTLAGVARAVDAPFSTFVIAVLSLPYRAGVSLAPAISAALSLLIGILAYAAVLSYYNGLKKRKKLAMNAMTKRNWRLVFAAIAVASVLYAAATYYVAYSASSTGAPFSSFSSAVASAKSLTVIVNGSEGYLASCANNIRAASLSAGKGADILYSNNGVCTINGTATTTDYCLHSAASSGTPVIMLSANQGSSIGIYSFYSTVMYVSGNQSFMDACYPALMVRG